MIPLRAPAASALALALLCLAARAQTPAGPDAVPPDNQHGHRIDLSAAYLTASDEPMVAGRDDARAVLVAALDLAARADPNGQLRNLSRLEAPVPKLIAPIPGVAFELWAEDTYSTYVESFTAGSAGIDRAERMTTVHRAARDNLRKLIVGYAVTIETLAEPGTYRLTFPEGAADDPLPPGFTRVRPGFPAPQILHDGDTLRLELYRNAQSDFRLVDYIHVGALNKMRTRTEAPHDSYAVDAEFNLTGARVQVNGATLASPALPETLRASIAWVYLPGYGRYDLSYKPDANAERIGEVSGAFLTFSEGRNIFRIQCSERIPAGSGAYRVYAVKHAEWIPADPNDRKLAMLGGVFGR